MKTSRKKTTSKMKMTSSMKATSKMKLTKEIKTASKTKRTSKMKTPLKMGIKQKMKITSKMMISKIKTTSIYEPKICRCYHNLILEFLNLKIFQSFYLSFISLQRVNSSLFSHVIDSFRYPNLKLYNKLFVMKGYLSE